MKEQVFQKMEKLKKMIQNHIGDGIWMLYKITVDDLDIVRLDSDLSKFDRYKEFITDDSCSLKVLVYFGKYRSRKTYEYCLTDAIKA